MGKKALLARHFIALKVNLNLQYFYLIELSIVTTHNIDAILEKEQGLQDPTRRRQRERLKNNRLYLQNNDFARASHFFVHVLAVFARLRRENAEIRVLWRT